MAESKDLTLHPARFFSETVRHNNPKISDWLFMVNAASTVRLRRRAAGNFEPSDAAGDLIASNLCWLTSQSWCFLGSAPSSPQR